MTTPHSPTSEPVDPASAARRGRRPGWLLPAVVVLAVVAIALARWRSGNRQSPERPSVQVQTMGTVEVKARLVELPGKFLPKKGLYNHAFILKYQVQETIRGPVGSDTIFVAHYNPPQPRSSVADEFFPKLGGSLQRFRAGDIHHLALDVPLDDHYIGAIVDRYHAVEKPVVYWAVWVE